MRHYLDHASTSPPRPEVVDAVTRWYAAPGGDPSRIHAEGMETRVALEQARESVAGLLGARARQVVFTSGGTEAIAAAVAGAAPRGDHQVLSAVEHSAVREAADRAGATTMVPVDAGGRVDPDAVAAAIGPSTSVVHVQWANHEVGTVQPVVEVAGLCRDRGVLCHIDAAQAVGHLPVDVGALGADLVSVSAHKFGGPPGVGVLVIRRGLRLDPLLVGGDQERARRAGLEHAPGIIGFGAAADALTTGDRLATEAAADGARTDRIRAAMSDIEGVTIHGDARHRLPHLVCAGFADVEPQAVLLGLDQAGVAVHSGSACASEGLEPSPVLEAMGLDAHRSLRASVGWSTTDDDVEALCSALPEVLADLRALARR